MSDFTIVEYDHSYAAALADMWNRSGDSWGGYNIEFTADAVRQKEEASACLHSYLAVMGDEVVGLIKLAQWTQDEGALYVDVLNVRPDLHGRKIGKALLLKTIERTTELGWSRLDLHTWGGNTKAVPLYKRSGFFWEERDKEVYCVNFIPGVLQNELVADFFADADWYRDSVRPIEIKPDGKIQNGFTYFTYRWDNAERFLVMEYARKGRGLCTIDRNDYRINARVEQLNLVFGRSYTVRYEIENRTPEPLSVQIEGRNDKNIRFDLRDSAMVRDRYSVEARFFVGEIDRSQSEWKTHPRVSALLTVNGKSAVFDVGVVPRFPAKVSLLSEGGLFIPEEPSMVHLDLESNLAEEADFTVELPGSDVTAFEPDRVERRLKPKQRVSVPLSCTVASCGIYARRLPVRARTLSGETIEFSTEVGMRMPSLGGIYHGEMADNPRERVYTIGNGPYSLSLVIERDSHINTAYLRNERTGKGGVYFHAPRLGKPYSEEFIRKAPESVSMSEDGGAVTMVAAYESEDFAGTRLSMCFRLYPVGVVERWFEVEQSPEVGRSGDLKILDEFRCSIDRLVLPYKDRIIATRSETDAGIWAWDMEQITGNWLFSHEGSGTVGFFWPESVQPCSHKWSLNFEHEVGEPTNGVRRRTPRISAFVDTFRTWKELREYAQQSRTRAPRTISSLALAVNGGNPFARGACTVVLREHKQKNLDGEIELSGRCSGEPDSIAPIRQAYSLEDRVKSAELEVPADRAPIELLTARLNLSVVRSTRKAVLFRVGDGNVQSETQEQEGFRVLTADNGALTVALAPEFSPSLLSCRAGDLSWLDTTFPELGPRDWWNPWLGGLYVVPSDVGEQALLREPRSASFIERKDSLGNLWSGLCMVVSFEEHEDYRGLQCSSYYLLLPGVPLLFHQAEIRQHTGRQLARKRFVTSAFVGSGRTADTAFAFRNADGDPVEIVSGHEERWQTVDGPATVGRKGRGERMTVYSEADRLSKFAVTNKRSTLIRFEESITCPDGDTRWTAPKFLIFDKMEHDGGSLAALQNVTLE